MLIMLSKSRKKQDKQKIQEQEEVIKALSRALAKANVENYNLNKIKER